MRPEKLPRGQHSLHRFTPGILLALITLMFAQAPQARAQDTVTGAFEGVVSDSQSGAALKGAFVEIVNQQTGLVYSLRTDYRGRFYQGLLLPGVYTVNVRPPDTD